MNIEQALRTELVNAATTAAGRVYPQKLPQDAVLPAITYAKISAPRGYDHDGPDGLVDARFQVSCWATTYLVVKALVAQVITVLSAFSGTMGGVGGVEVGKSFVINEVDMLEPDVGIWHVPLDINLGYKEV